MSEPVVLIVEDDTTIRTVLNQSLTRAGYTVRATSHIATLWNWIGQGIGDVLLTDVVLPDENIFNVLPKIREARPNLPFIVMSAENTVMTAIRASEAGAFEYLPKPFDINELTSVIGNAILERKKKQEKKKLENDEEDQLPIVGRSMAMQNVYRTLAKLMHTELTVIIYGESGTGKELVAKALHDFGKRKNGPFVALNMAAIPKDLIESELFGHEKGAFTGAQARSAGRFEQAEGGTLFLDEIGDMPIDAQTRLLRVLQEGEYTTVGGRSPIKANVRIIAATHQDLKKRIDKGQFREDLFYRLNVVPINLPPLRTRLEDIPDLVDHFLSQCYKEGLPIKKFSKEAIEQMQSYEWPGNIRELENTVRRMAALHSEEEISGLTILQEIKKENIETEISLQSNQVSDLRSAAENYLAWYFGQYEGELPPDGLYDKIIFDVEGPLISAALSATKGNQIKASSLLGINRNTLRKKIREHDIEMKATKI